MKATRSSTALAWIVLAGCNPSSSTAPAARGGSSVVPSEVRAVPGAEAGTVVVEPSRASAAQVAPELFRALFERGRRWEYRLKVESSHWDAQDPRADAQGTVRTSSEGAMTCRVTEVRVVGPAIAAELACERTIGVTLGNPGPDGVYVATGAGLWRLDAMPSEAELAALRGEDMVLAAAPAARKTRDEDAEGFGSSTEVEQKGGDWCVRRQSWGGDEGGASLCFRPGVGISAGSEYFAGGSIHDVTYSLDAPSAAVPTPGVPAPASASRPTPTEPGSPRSTQAP